MFAYASDKCQDDWAGPCIKHGVFVHDNGMFILFS